MSKTQETVYIGKQSSGNTYHASKDCLNFPKEHREKTPAQIPYYEPCSICAAGETKQPVYECVECGNEKRLPRRQAAAKPEACQICQSVTRHEHIER